MTDSNEVIQKEILQSEILFLAATAPHPHLWSCALKQLHKLWSGHTSLRDLHCSILLTLDPSLPVLCMLAALSMQSLSEQKLPLAADVQAKMLDIYCKVVLQSRTVVDMQLLVRVLPSKCGQCHQSYLILVGKMSFHFHMGYT